MSKQNRRWTKPADCFTPDGDRVMYQRNCLVSAGLAEGTFKISDVVVCTGYLELEICKDDQPTSLPLTFRVYDPRLQSMVRQMGLIPALNNWSGLVQIMNVPAAKSNGMYISLRPYDPEPPYGAKPGNGTMYLMNATDAESQALRDDKRIFALRSGASQPVQFAVIPDGYVPVAPAEPSAVEAA